MGAVAVPARPGSAPGASDEGRFEAFVREHEKRLRAFVLRRTASREEADDVVAATFVVAWDKFDTIPEAAPFGWLCGVALRVVLNEWRSRRRRTALRDRLHGEAPVHVHDTRIERSSLLREQSELVLAALASLSRDDEQLLRMATWDHLDADELALALDLSPAAARKRLSRARQRFRDSYERLRAEAEKGGADA